jgi:aryl-alcohol dehydrogenase-like predicted oxidoreductase
MQYRRMGSTDLAVSEIAFGCGGTAGLMVRGSFDEQVRAAARAIELGINYFDESPDYGDGSSEENLGRVLRELGVRPIIDTKVESVDESLRRLGVDWVDIVQIHGGPVGAKPTLTGRAYNVLWIEDYLRPGGALEGLQRLLSTGKTRYIGFICRGNDGPYVRQLIDTGCFHMINLVYNLLNPSAGARRVPGLEPGPDFGGVIDYAYEHGVGVAVYNPLAGGLLTDTTLRGGAPHPLSRSRVQSEAAQPGVRRAQALAFLSKEGRTMAQAGMRFILDHPGVTTVLGGFSGIEHLEEAVPASGAPSLTAEEMARIEMVWRSNFGGVSPMTGRGD